VGYKASIPLALFTSFKISFVYCIYKLDIMKKLLFLLLLVPVVSCSSDDEPSETTSSIFLEKHNNTIWEENTEFYYKSLADIKFSNSEYFIYFKSFINRLIAGDGK